MLLPLFATGQYTSSKERPSWVSGGLTDLQNSYIDVVSATGYSEDNARDKAVRMVLERRSLTTGQRVNVNVSGKNIIIDGNDALTVKARIIDEYIEWINPGEYRISLLVQTAKNPEYAYENISVTNRYPFSARVFVPGMAQIYKGNTTKGALFIAGEVAAIGGIVAFECLRSSYTSKINSTHDTAARKDYISKADNMKNIRNGFIVGAAAIYIWNIIDGAVAKGKLHVVADRAQMQVVPYASAQSGGVMMSITF